MPGFSGSDSGRAVAASGDGGAWFTGGFSRTVDFGGGPLTASGNGADIALVEIGP